jgi:hypothetical protein
VYNVPENSLRWRWRRRRRSLTQIQIPITMISASGLIGRVLIYSHDPPVHPLLLSLTWTFMHLSRFRFPHRNTKSDDVVCLMVSEPALSNNDASDPPMVVSLPLVLFTLALVMLLLLRESLSI